MAQAPPEEGLLHLPSKLCRKDLKPIPRNSGQIGVLPNHTPIAIVVDISILRIHFNDQWLTMALMSGFARIGNNEITILVNDAEKDSEINLQEALRQARTRVKAINAIS
ncbi:hypothetical protein BT93_G0197 [Corymbia citriodora subsp. variegata]|nr:hypothetical protein BT93_G0197 [Corymbia citriodora subsp. variegata]